MIAVLVVSRLLFLTETRAGIVVYLLNVVWDAAEKRLRIKRSLLELIVCVVAITALFCCRMPILAGTSILVVALLEVLALGFGDHAHLVFHVAVGELLGQVFLDDDGLAGGLVRRQVDQAETASPDQTCDGVPVQFGVWSQTVARGFHP